ncbi:hypothetical protein P8452_51055 [Trifolium repens]|nr:hypothetical protein P8452_51055 [Trifolium repens]
MVHIAKREGITNSISILRADNVVNGNKGYILFLQDSWTDSFGSMVVYSPINMQSLNTLMHGGDSSCVALLPSGFSILLDGHSNNNTITGSSSDGSGIGGNSRYFLAVGIQMLLNDLQTSQLTIESVDTINELISCTI